MKRKKEIIQETQGRLIDATSTLEAIEVMKTHYDQLGLHVDPSDSPREEYEKSKSAAKPVYSALGELAWRTLTQEMATTYVNTGTLERDGGASMERYKTYSPALQRFMATMDAWLRPTLQDIFDEAKVGEMPHAAIYEVLAPVRARRLKSANEWQRPQQEAKGKAWEDSPDDPEDHVKAAWTTINLRHAASNILGRSIVANTRNEGELTAILLGDLDRVSRLSSAIRGMTEILFTSDEFLRQYSNWELGKLSAEEFLAYCQTNPWCSDKEFHPRLATGRVKNPGHCTADTYVSRPEHFMVSPEDFLKVLGVQEPGEITLTKLYVASATVAARDTILTVLPRY